MEALKAEVVQHMLEAADAKKFSLLFLQPDHWRGFNHWCQSSSEASRILSRSGEEIETFCLDKDSQLYCVAMSLETLDSIVRSLVESYENEELERLFGG